MAPRSRTGKLMQGLFGRFGKKQPVPPISPATPRQQGTRSQSEIDEREFPIASRFDDDEETNWDDAEAQADQNNQVVYAQPIVPVVTAPNVSTTADLDDWDEALPAATVRNSNIQEVRRGKPPVAVDPNQDIWDENIPSQTFSLNSKPNPSPVVEQLRPSSAPNPIETAVGLWAATLHQFRRILPGSLRQLTDPILTAIVVAIVTITIWLVNGLLFPRINSSANLPPAPITAQPLPPVVSTAPKVSPEQAFIEAIQTQLNDITSQYPDNIIQTLSVDITRDRLIVRLNPIWYLITDDRQNSLTDRMWLQAQANHFTKLEIQDTQGVAIARNPVVGKQMIILQRRQSD
jgi:hypothetical protein